MCTPYHIWYCKVKKRTTEKRTTEVFAVAVEFSMQLIDLSMTMQRRLNVLHKALDLNPNKHLLEKLERCVHPRPPACGFMNRCSHTFDHVVYFDQGFCHTKRLVLRIIN